MKKAMSFRDLDIFNLAKKLAIEIHHMTLDLPKFELYGEGSQIRRSSESYLGAISECDEIQVHLEMLSETNSLKDKERSEYFRSEYNKLARKLNKVYSSVLDQHISEK